MEMRSQAARLAAWAVGGASKNSGAVGGASAAGGETGRGSGCGAGG
ncbi:MAG TPA: hypothetical protein VG797_11080 [Phycisphaerales bacterium]|nr:hypothetical protein [Phycisphaerales bacterium]